MESGLDIRARTWTVISRRVTSALAFAACVGVITAVTPRVVTAGVTSGFDARRTWVVAQFRSPRPLDPNPVVGLPHALARLSLSGGKDRRSFLYCARVLSGRSPEAAARPNDEIFIYPALAQFLYLFGEQLSLEERKSVEQQLTGRALDLLEHGTENHAIKRVASAYLFAQYFPDAIWTDGQGKKRTSVEQLAEAKRLILSRGRSFFRVGNNEQLSTTYAPLNLYPVLNLCDFARDAEVRAAAEALALYHFAAVAANTFDGHLMPPFNRQNAQQSRFGSPVNRRGRFLPVAQLIAWLYWGQNEVIPEDFNDAGEPPYAVFFALSKWAPPPLIERVATERKTYALRSSLPTAGPWGASPRTETLRSMWRDADFAIGACAGQFFDPDGYFIDYSLFNIAWRSADRFRYLECGHPFWRSNKGEDAWSKGMASPFQQAAHHRNAAIVLFNIPEKDPWASRGEQRWQDERDAHADRLIRLGQCRFPKSVDECVTDGDFYFLREGEVFIAVRVLKPGHSLVGNRPGAAEFNVIKSYESRTGFVFEVGNRADHADLDAFRAKVKANPTAIDWDKMEVSYQACDGTVLRMRYHMDLTPVNGVIPLVPDVSVSGRPLQTSSWPLFESPVVSLEEGVLRIEQGGERIVANWRGALPMITYGRPHRRPG